MAKNSTKNNNLEFNFSFTYKGERYNHKTEKYEPTGEIPFTISTSLDALEKAIKVSMGRDVRSLMNQSCFGGRKMDYYFTKRWNTGAFHLIENALEVECEGYTFDPKEREGGKYVSKHNLLRWAEKNGLLDRLFACGVKITAPTYYDFDLLAESIIFVKEFYPHKKGFDWSRVIKQVPTAEEQAQIEKEEKQAQIDALEAQLKALKAA